MGNSQSHSLLSFDTKLTWKFYLACTGLSVITFIIYVFAIDPFLSPLRKIPGPGYNPIFGNVREAMVGQAMETSVKWVKQYGRIVRFYYLLGRQRLLVADPAALKQIFLTNEKNYERPGSVNTARLIGCSVLLSTGHTHKVQRRLLNPLFNHTAVTGYLATFEKYAWKLIDLWSDDRTGPDSQVPITVQNDLKRMTLDIFGEAVLGFMFKSLHQHDSAIVQAFHSLTAAPAVRLENAIPWMRFLPTTYNKRRQQMLDTVDELVYGIIKQRKKEINKHEPVGCCHLVDQLLLARNEESGEGLSEKEIHDQLLALIIAGYETTSMTMSWLLLLLAEHPDVQRRVREESVAVLPPRGQPLTRTHLEQLRYLDCVIKEGQRLYPAAPSFHRRARREDHLGGYKVPTGTLLILHVGAMMRDPTIWEDPEQFQPERFMNDDAPPLYGHLPFGAGPHKCLGHQFARLQMRLILALILRDFYLSVIPGYKVKRKLRTTLQPEPPVKLILRRVSS